MTAIEWDVLAIAGVLGGLWLVVRLAVRAVRAIERRPGPGNPRLWQ